MGGSIGVESNLGKAAFSGLKFRLKSAPPCPEIPFEFRQKGMRALVLDDQEEAREIMAGILSKIGLRVQLADSGNRHRSRQKGRPGKGPV